MPRTSYVIVLTIIILSAFARHRIELPIKLNFFTSILLLFQHYFSSLRFTYFYQFFPINFDIFLSNCCSHFAQFSTISTRFFDFNWELQKSTHCTLKHYGKSFSEENWHSVLIREQWYFGQNGGIKSVNCTTTMTRGQKANYRSNQIHNLDSIFQSRLCTWQSDLNRFLSSLNTIWCRHNFQVRQLEKCLVFGLHLVHLKYIKLRPLLCYLYFDIFHSRFWPDLEWNWDRESGVGFGWPRYWPTLGNCKLLFRWATEASLVGATTHFTAAPAKSPGAKHGSVGIGVGIFTSSSSFSTFTSFLLLYIFMIIFEGRFVR